MKTKTLFTLAALSAAATPLLRADPLDPTAFASLGTPTFAAGTYNVETSSDYGAPTINVNGTVYTGVFSGSGTSAVAVFDFTNLNIPAGVTLAGVNDASSHPFAILSRGTFTLAGSIIADGSAGAYSNGNSAPGGNAGPGGGGGGGGGGYHNTTYGAGGAGLYAGSVGGTAGSGFGGAGGGPGGASAAPPGANGASGGFGGAGVSDFSGNARGGGTYGNLRTLLQGGSGGGGGSYRSNQAGGSSGGGGGGGVELGATLGLTLTGTVSANGGGAGQGGAYGGNGSGGGILLHAQTITLNGTGTQLSAAGGTAAGAPGGGGEIAFGTLLGNGPDGTNATGYSVAGANNGTVTNFTVNAVPEPSTWAAVVLGAAGLGVVTLRRQVRRA